MNRTLALAALSLACHAVTDDDTTPVVPSPTGDTATGTTDTAPVDTGTPTAPKVEDTAACGLTLNPLRGRCEVRLVEPAAATLTLTAKGAPTRTFASDAVVTDHDIAVWGLVPDTTYTWSVAGLEGTLTTAPLPSDFPVRTQVTGDASALDFDAVVRSATCGASRFAMMVDPQGRVVWYEPIAQGGPLTGYGSLEWSEEHRTVLISNQDGFSEMDLEGRIVLELLEGRDYPQGQLLHHDSDRWGDLRYLLFQHQVDGYLVDGVHVFRNNQLVGTFDLADHFPVGGAAQDWSHGNGVNVTDDGVMILSFLHFDAVVAVDGDPTSPTFLQILWHAAGGAGTGFPGADLVAVGGPGQGFDRQHNASLFGDDLWLFDNYGQSTSRAVRLAMDPVAGSLTVTGSWSMDQRCPIQGGSLPVPGGVLATCASGGGVWAFEEGASDPAWQMRATCGGFSVAPLNRGIPTWFE